MPLKGVEEMSINISRVAQSFDSLKDELKLLAQFTLMWESTEITFPLTALDLCEKGSGQHFY